MMIPVTFLSSYLYCPRKLFIEQVLKIKEPVKEPLIIGSIWHDALEKINQAEELLVKGITPSTDINKLFQISHARILRNSIIKFKSEIKRLNLSMPKLFKQAWPIVSLESNERSFNVFNFIKKKNIFGEELWHALEPKITSEVRIESKEFQLRGVVDQIHNYADNIIPIELKTGKAPLTDAWPGHKVQIGAYMLLLGSNKGVVKYLEQEKKVEIIMNPFLKQEILELRDKVRSLLESKELPKPCSNENKCKYCSLKEHCISDNSLLERLGQRNI